MGAANLPLCRDSVSNAPHMRRRILLHAFIEEQLSTRGTLSIALPQSVYRCSIANLPRPVRALRDARHLRDDPRDSSLLSCRTRYILCRQLIRPRKAKHPRNEKKPHKRDPCSFMLFQNENNGG